MEQYQNFLFITFVLQYQQNEYRARCRGCREILIPDYKTPSHIRGVIELDGKYIPVIDPRISFHGEPAELSPSACILVIEYDHEYQKRYTGVIVPDFQEVTNLVAGNYKPGTAYEPSFNVRFIKSVFEGDNSRIREELGKKSRADGPSIQPESELVYS